PISGSLPEITNMENELWLTKLFNDYLAAPATAVLGMLKITPHDAARPWENWIVVELFVVALLMLLVAIVKAGLSADKPGGIQHTFEVIYDFIKHTAEQAGVHHAEKYVPYFATIFLFILTMNLIGIIPAFESPTMSPWVPAGLAICTFLYYNVYGIKAQGLGKYLAHLAGPVAWLAPVVVIIRLISHFARPPSAPGRLFGNM